MIIPIPSMLFVYIVKSIGEKKTVAFINNSLMANCIQPKRYNICTTHTALKQADDTKVKTNHIASFEHTVLPLGFG